MNEQQRIKSEINALFVSAIKARKQAEQPTERKHKPSVR